MVAVLADANRRVVILPQELARLAIETFIREGKVIKPPAELDDILATPKAGRVPLL